MFDTDTLGRDWVLAQAVQMTHEIERLTPVEYNQKYRYLPEGVTPRPGFIRYDRFPFMVEILDCFDPRSPVREVNLMKGVQTAFTTVLESIILYYLGHIKTQAGMFLTADKELATGRMDNNIMPMLVQSNLDHLIRSSDPKNPRKTGKTKDYIQWDGGGFLIINGAQNAKKMRMYSVPLLLKDELDGWSRHVGDDGNPDNLTDDRASAYWARRKILRGSTPLTYPSLINDAYERGDKRAYLVKCFSCGFPQELRMEHVDPETGDKVKLFKWELENGVLVKESVRYECRNCGHAHYEADKTKLFSAASGAHWSPTREDADPEIRSYHLPAFYSPYGFQPWYKNIQAFVSSQDQETGQYVDVGKLQWFYNNALGVPFTPKGGKIHRRAVSRHRRAAYTFGEIPNDYAFEHASSRILFLTCQVDVHKGNLAVAVMGWTSMRQPFVIDYWRFEPTETDKVTCEDVNCSVWERLRELIEDKRYTADDGAEYGILLTLVDASYATDTVKTFCADYLDGGVHPIYGREMPAKNQAIKEFDTVKSSSGALAYRVTVDLYKDRNAPVLRREWDESRGKQRKFHFNAPIDMTEDQITELTRETKVEEHGARGAVKQVWYRPGNAPNELWDLLQYGHAAVEIFAHSICLVHFKLERVDWDNFFQFCALPEHDNVFNRLTPKSR